MLTPLPIVVAYLLGSIPFGLIVGRLAGIGDIRGMGSGNIGATNVWRVAGFKAAVWVFIGDIGKGALAVQLGRYFASPAGVPLMSVELFLVLCAVGAVAGHVFPLYTRFKGGKGVNTALGALLVLRPVESLIAFGVFLLVVVVFRYVSLGSITGALAFLGALVIRKYALQAAVHPVYVYLSVAMALLIIITHRGNISRLMAGTENRFSLLSHRNKEVRSG